jgi:hypothetical protein
MGHHHSVYEKPTNSLLQHTINIINKGNSILTKLNDDPSKRAEVIHAAKQLSSILKSIFHFVHTRRDLVNNPSTAYNKTTLAAINKTGLTYKDPYDKHSYYNNVYYSNEEYLINNNPHMCIDINRSYPLLDYYSNNNDADGCYHLVKNFHKKYSVLIG